VEKPRPSVAPRGQAPYKIDEQWYYPIEDSDGFEEEGLASWYGPGFHGRRTANGERYDQNGMTAAHRTLPLGTRVKVTDVDTGREVEVRINDRGPFKRGRVIDLSYAAARKLRMVERGLARVRVESLGRPGEPVNVKCKPLDRAWLTVQAGAFREPRNAHRFRDRLASMFDHVDVLLDRDGDGDYYRVHVGRFSDVDQARRELNNVRSNGFFDAFLVRVEER
jgi:rare lipoprotein A